MMVLPTEIPQRVHMVGIGGIGLSAIARILAAWGHEVTGSDLRASAVTRGLNALGIRTYEGQRAEQVRGAELVVISSAVPEANVEVVAARQAGIPVIKRHLLLGMMLDGYYGIAVAGTHGKTTTTTMISIMLTELGQSPSYIIGGIVPQLGGNAQAGQGRHFVIEADEYDRTFHGLRPDIAVVTSIEMDHPDCYADIAAMREAYATFLAGVPEGLGGGLRRLGQPAPDAVRGTGPAGPRRDLRAGGGGGLPAGRPGPCGGRQRSLRHPQGGARGRLLRCRSLGRTTP